MSSSTVASIEDAPHPERLEVESLDGRIVGVTRYRGTSSSVAVYLHGGAWIMGSRDDHPGRLRALALAGPTVVSIDYALATEAPFPAQREDVEAVVAALVPRNAPFVLIGASAGAHLAALSAFTMTHPPVAVVGLFGRYDLTSDAAGIRPPDGAVVPDEIAAARPAEGYEELTHRGRLALLAGVAEAELDDQRLAELSPVRVLSGSAPDVLVLHGTADGVIGSGHSQRLVDAAEAAGVPALFRAVPGANHEDPVFADPEVVGIIAEFIEDRIENDTRRRTS